jgi:integrase
VNTVFRWGVSEKHLPRNPFERAADALTVSKQPKYRDTLAFTPEERKKILSSASGIEAFRKRDDAARRWVPWLCAYTGARVGEITQLRQEDVIERGGIHALKITPEAGTVWWLGLEVSADVLQGDAKVLSKLHELVGRPEGRRAPV